MPITAAGSEHKTYPEQGRSTLSRFAVAMAKDQRAISEYENGKRKLSATDLPLFAQVLNVPLLYFYDGEIKIDDLDRMALQEFKQLPDVQANKQLFS